MMGPASLPHNLVDTVVGGRFMEGETPCRVDLNRLGSRCLCRSCLKYSDRCIVDLPLHLQHF